MKAHFIGKVQSIETQQNKSVDDYPTVQSSPTKEVNYSVDLQADHNVDQKLELYKIVVITFAVIIIAATFKILGVV